MIDQLTITAYVQVRKAGGKITGIGHRRFVTLPRIGELVHVRTDHDEIVIEVVGVDHQSFVENETPLHDSVLLTGEIVD